MKIQLTTRYINAEAIVKVQRVINYEGEKNVDLAIYSLAGEPLCKATVPLANEFEPIVFPEVAIKDYSENEGLLKCLISQKVVNVPSRLITHHFPTHSVVFPICKLTSKAIKELGLEEESIQTQDRI